MSFHKQILLNINFFIIFMKFYFWKENFITFVDTNYYTVTNLKSSIMKTLVIALFMTFALIQIVIGQKTWTFESQANKVLLYKGDLSQGAVIPDLSWASTSNNACWPATENTYFNGNHIFYVTSIPAHAELTVTVIPDDPSQNMSIYGFQDGLGHTALPPNISSCVACESERKWDRPKVGKTQDHTRSIYFNSTTDSYRIVIGVVGAEGLQTGTFKIKVDLKADVPNIAVQQEVITKKITLSGNTTTLKGNLQDGVIIQNLDWASTSNMACWPGTQNTKFRGNHVFYETEVPTNMDIKITVIPDDVKANFSIYTIQTGVGRTDLPPNITTCTACEAEHFWDYPKKGKTQDHTRFVELNSFSGPWRLVIGVVGAETLTTGAYTLKIEMTPMK